MLDTPDVKQSADKKDLTKGEPALKENTIKELKSKLESKELVDGDEIETAATMIPDTLRNSGHHTTPPLLTDDDGLIIPRKPANPVRDNPERQNLHKELLFNQKIGKNVLNQKTELQRALQRQKENLAKKQLENHIAAQAPELEKVIADRAKRLQHPNGEKNEDDKVISKELVQVRMKLRTRHDSK
ncbi:protein FAM107B isoform X2 [Anoplophora glabripennis]|uniref:protein FAM107B isoform X2 n=1 Tax=Anoplophora glabripennis TaxID=217634 RepID=UPI000873F87D|nr:protein FAM107B isoform X2 [Anoplophora glabripennis]